MRRLSFFILYYLMTFSILQAEDIKPSEYYRYLDSLPSGAPVWPDPLGQYEIFKDVVLTQQTVCPLYTQSTLNIFALKEYYTRQHHWFSQVIKMLEQSSYQYCVKSARYLSSDLLQRSEALHEALLNYAADVGIYPALEPNAARHFYFARCKLNQVCYAIILEIKAEVDRRMSRRLKREYFDRS